MEIDPHTIQQLLGKVREQLRCPQCTRKVDVDLPALKVVSETFAVFQLKCVTCGAYILLHATIAGTRPEEARLSIGALPERTMTVEIDATELRALRAALKEAGGCFSQLFQAP